MNDKTQTDLDLEAIATEICETFEVYSPPVPVELMLQQPLADMWEEVDITQLSGAFLSFKDRYSPRMSLARLLVRHIAASDWGASKGLHVLIEDQDRQVDFARMVMMPAEMVQSLTSSQRNPKTMSMHFEVPEEDARQRLYSLI